MPPALIGLTMRYNRRNFIQSTTSATSALLLASLDGWTAPAPINRPHPGFSLKVLATDWGFKGSIDDYCAQVNKEGYDGIELWWPLAKPTQQPLFAAPAQYPLDLAPLLPPHHPHAPHHLPPPPPLLAA